MINKKYKIYEENGHLGIMAEDGTRMTPAVYDEIQTDERQTDSEDYFLCRVFQNWDIFNLLTRQTGFYDRDFYFFPNGKHVDNKPTTLEDREIYDSISEFEKYGVTYVYKNGKFGYNNKDGKFSLPAEFDNITHWAHGNVIETRKGLEYRYFNLEGNEILTGNQKVFGERFWEGCDSFDEQIALRRIVEEPDDQTYQSEVGLIRFDSYSIEEFYDSLIKIADVQPVRKDVMDNFNDLCGSWFDAFEIRMAKPKCHAHLKKEIERLEKMGAFGSYSQMVDVFVSNENTPICDNIPQMLQTLYRKIDKVEKGSGHGIGRDNSLADGEVRWIHCEFYYE